MATSTTQLRRRRSRGHQRGDAADERRTRERHLVGRARRPRSPRRVVPGQQQAGDQRERQSGHPAERAQPDGRRDAAQHDELSRTRNGELPVEHRARRGSTDGHALLTERTGIRFTRPSCVPLTAARATGVPGSGACPACHARSGCAPPASGEIRTVPLPSPGPDEVLVRTLYSGISRGTETLVFRGGVPPSQHAADARAVPGG